MNKIHRIVWSAIRGAFIVAHELACAHGKPSSTRRTGASSAGAVLLASTFGAHRPGGESGQPVLSALSLAVCLAVTTPAVITPAFAAPATNQLPTGGQIVGGAAAGSISTSGSAMTVNQTQQRMIANWESFSIGSAASVHFQQPAGGVALNRVTGGQPSEIFGKLSATGAVYLLNSAGILFGRSAQVDVGALVASTGKLSDADFLAGKLKILQEASGGKIANEGQLKAAMEGYIALLAPEVRNQGVIFAEKGTVALAAGQAYELQFNGTKLANVRVTPGDFTALVENGNAVEAPGGLIILSAHAVTRLQGAAIRNNGTLDASSMTVKGGRIVLESSDRIENTGTLKASGGSVQAGGSIEMTAPVIEQRGTLDVSGTTGGSITLRATEQILHAAGALIDASGLSGSLGNAAQGGHVSLEAAQILTVAGTITAAATANATDVTTGSGGEITLAAGQSVTVDNAKVDAGGTAQGGRVTVKAERTVATGLLDPANPLNDPTAPGTPTNVAITGATTLTTRSLPADPFPLSAAPGHEG